MRGPISTKFRHSETTYIFLVVSLETKLQFVSFRVRFPNYLKQDVCTCSLCMSSLCSHFNTFFEIVVMIVAQKTFFSALVLNAVYFLARN